MTDTPTIAISRDVMLGRHVYEVLRSSDLSLVNPEFTLITET
jgi:hypothetical protein